MMDWVETGPELCDLRRIAQRSCLILHAFHRLVLAHVLGTCHHNGGLKYLLKVLSGVMQKNFTKEPRDKVGLPGWGWG